MVDFILRRARDDAKVRVLPSAALTKGLIGDEIAEIGLLAEAGAIAFCDGPHSVADARTMRRAMTYARDFDALVAPVCEDRRSRGEGVMAEGLRASWLGLPGVPREAETIVLERDLRLVALTGARYHAALVSNRLSLEAMARAREAGLPATCGVSINHLTLNELDVGDYRTFLKLNPPLRAEDERMALVEALQRRPHRRHLLRPRSAGRRDQAAPVRRGGGGRDRRRDDAVGELATGRGGPCQRCPRLIRAMTAAPGRDPQAAGRQACGRRAGGRHPLRSRRALCARSGLAPFALPQHALRRGPARRPGQADAGCRAGRARIGSDRKAFVHRRRLEARMVGISYGGALALALGYLLGSIPFGLVLTRLFGAGDLRSIGSGNIGATNVLRTGRKGLAAATLVLDALKATLAVVARLVGVWAADRRLRPRRARSSATSIRSGSSFAAARAWRPFSAASSASPGRRRSRSRSSGSRSRPSRAIPPRRPWRRRSFRPSPRRRSGESGAALVFAALAALIWVKHSANIVRLLNGAESKIGQKD